MASSTSQALETIHGLGTIRQINDAIYEFHRPAEGFIDLDIVFFHGFQAQGCDAYWRTWMLADGSACWLNTWLAEEYPQSRIMSVAYDSRTEVTDSDGRMDMYVVWENLAQSIIVLAGVGKSCPVVLVGHGVGGMVLKAVCCRAEQLGNRLKAKGADINPYETFLRSMKGAFFFSTPHLGTPVQANLKRRSRLLKYYELLSAHSARLNSSFQDLRKPYRYGWKTCGIIEANVTKNRESSFQSAMTPRFGWEPQSSLVVVEGSGRIDMDEFYVLDGKDSSTICKPEERSSSNFQILLKFVQGILEEELALKNWISILQFPRVFISMPERVREVVQTLRLGEAEPSRVSLVGMGGIGKSTLAKELLVKIRSQFDFLCYVDDVKDRLKRHDLHTLVADNLYYRSGTKVIMQDVDAQSLWLILKGKKVLLIMDNVDSEEQIGNLLMPDWGQEGSRLLVTSRQRTEQLMRTFLVHEVPVLSHDESKNLFLAHLDMGIVQKIPEEIFHQVVAKCDGLPLTLEVIGSYLRFEADPSVWEHALERLRNAESISGGDDDRLWAELRVNFDVLGPPERRMFLDLAVFDKCEPNALQYDLRTWRAVWETNMNRSMVNSALRNLVDKCFIRISTKSHSNSLSEETGESELQYLAFSSVEEFVDIQEHLRDMGKTFVRPYFEKIELCRGVWESKDVDELLAKNKGENTHAEMLSVFKPHSGKQYSWSSIGHLRQLRLLRMSNVGMRGDRAQRFPPNLEFFHMNACWRVRAKRPFHFLENDYWPIRGEDVALLHRLTVLILENCSSVRFPGNFHDLHSLRLLIIRETELLKLPKKFGLLPSLQVLFLERVGLAKLPDSFLQLSSLESLNLSGCPALKALPELPVQNLQSMLKRVVLEELPALRELPETFGLLGSLEEVRITECSGLVKLPESFGRCHKLKDLQITQCASFESLGESFGKLTNLQRLRMEGCENLQSLPECLGQLHSLERLDISKCSSLERLPESIGLLRNLQHLRMEGCENLQSLPECLGQLHSLERLDISKCSSLEQLPESIGLLRNLQHLRMEGCENLQSLPECLCQLHSLECFYISKCSSLERLPESIGLLRNLQRLDMEVSPSIQLIEGDTDRVGRTESGKLELSSAQVEKMPVNLVEFRNLTQQELTVVSSIPLRPDVLGFQSFKREFDPERVLCIYNVSQDPDAVKIFFLHVEGMATLFGVGLPYSLVLLRKGGVVEIKQLPQQVWTDRWCVSEMSNFSLVLLDCSSVDSAPTPRRAVQALSPEEAAEQFGVGLEGGESYVGMGEFLPDMSNATAISPPWIADLHDYLRCRGHAGTHSQDGEKGPGRDNYNHSTTDPSVPSSSGSAQGTTPPEEKNHRSQGQPLSEVTRVERGMQNQWLHLTVRILLDHDSCAFYNPAPVSLDAQSRNSNFDHCETLTDVDPVLCEFLMEPEVTIEFLYYPHLEGSIGSKKMSTTLDVNFLMDGAISEPDKFGWYHDQLRLSFGCTEAKKVRREERSNEIRSEHGPQTSDRVSARGNSTAELKGNGKEMQARVGHKYIANVQGSSNWKRENTVGTSQNQESSARRSFDVLTKANFCIRSVRRVAELTYLASIYPPLTTYDVWDDNDRAEAHASGMMSAVRIQIKGYWVIMQDVAADRSEAFCKYEFSCQRELKQLRRNPEKERERKNERRKHFFQVQTTCSRGNKRRVEYDTSKVSAWFSHKS